MIAIAILLLLIVAVFTVAVVAGNPGVFNLSIFGAHVPVSASGVYFNGAGAMLVLILALSLLRRGIRREFRRRKQVRALRSAASRKTRSPAEQGRVAGVGTPTGDATAGTGAAGREVAVGQGADAVSAGGHVAPGHVGGGQASEPVAPRQASEPVAPRQASEPVAQGQASEPVAQGQASEPVARERASGGPTAEPNPALAQTTTTPAERQALLDETDELTGDSPGR